MRNIFNIVKKELDKVFKNPRLIFSTFILPSLMIFIMYSFMGSSANTQAEKVQSHDYKIVVINDSMVIKNALNSIPKLSFTWETGKTMTNEEIKAFLENKESEAYLANTKSIVDEQIDLYLYLPENFDTNVATASPSDVNLLYYSLNKYSSYLYGIINSVIDSIETTINPQNPVIIKSVGNDTVTEAETNKSVIAMLIPMLIMTFIFASALSIACDAIAGEKERGTISTMLMAPINKNEIILGKILSSIILTIVSAICSFVGLMFSLLNNANFFGGSEGMKLEYGFGTYAQVFLVLVMISLLAVSIFLLASTIAKTTKEATMYAMPVYIVGILSGSLSMFNSLPTDIWPYLIPIYNLSLALKGILTNGTIVYMPVICLSTVVYFVLIILMVNRLFKNERIMFAK